MIDSYTNQEIAFVGQRNGVNCYRINDAIVDNANVMTKRKLQPVSNSARIKISQVTHNIGIGQSSKNALNAYDSQLFGEVTQVSQ